MAHLKRLKAPKSWPLLRRKGIKFIARPLPGPHSLVDSIPLNVILKDYLKYAKTTRDSKKILNKGMVIVNGRIRKSHKFAVGILDTISLETLNEHYRVFYDKKGKFFLDRIKKEQTESRILKINNKTILRKKKMQLNFHDGTNLIVEKGDYKTGDTLLLKEGKIKKHLKFEKGAWTYLVKGKHKGKVGIIEKIEEPSAVTKGIITINTEEGAITTKKDFAFIIGKLK